MSDLIISASEIAEALNKIFGNFNFEVQEVIKKQTDKSTKELKELIRSAAPKRTRKYSESWRVKLTENTTFRYSKTVYSYDRYMVTHLLENGHALRRGGRAIGKGKVKAYKHISPSYEQIQKSYIADIQTEIIKNS